MNEKMRLKFLEIFEDFSVKKLPDELKFISSKIRPDLIKNDNNSFYKKYEFGSYKFNLNIDYVKGNKQPYFSNLDYSEFFINPYAIFDIPVKVIDENIDIDSLLSVIIHEVRHIYDIYNVASEYEINEFYKGAKINIFKDTLYKNFTNYIYHCLEHELIARHNMLYTQFRWIGITDKNRLYELYLNSYVYNSLKWLSEFNHIEFINKFKMPDLIYYTNIFIKDVAKENNFCNSSDDIIDYYKKWEDFFKNKSSKYLSYVDDMLDDVISDIKNDKFFENVVWEYNEYKIDGAFKIFKEFYNEIFDK